jgi:hypothetical protein
MNFITDLPESDGATMILVVVDRITKMAHFIPAKTKDSPAVATVYLENVWKYHGFPEDVVLDQDGTLTGHIIPDVYNYLGIPRSMSTAYHPQSDSQTESINQVIEAYHVGKTFGATLTDIYYPCYYCVTVASYRL